MSLKPGTQHPITIEKLVFQGWGLGRIEGIAVFVPNSLPGDELIVEIQHKKKRHLMAKKVETTLNSTFRAESRCPHYPSCGGCQLMDVPYEKQLELKRAILEDCFEGQFSELLEKFHRLIPSPSDHYYRNKMDFAFGQNENGLYLGLKERGRYDHVIPISDCQLMSADSMRLTTTLCELLNQNDYSAWDYNSNNGSLRYASLRHSKTHDQYMLTLICGQKIKDSLHPLMKTLSEKEPKLSSIHYLFTDAPGDNIQGLSTELLGGKDHLHEALNQQEFSISPLSFFQTNTTGAEKLYECTREMAQLRPSDTVMDLYCGTGTIGLSMAPYVQQVIGIEENPSATADAAENAKRNDVSNIQFRTGRVKNILKFEQFEADVVVVDPPRSGLVPKALRRTAEIGAERLIYVSCNPTTLCRDLKEFSNLGYRVEEVVGVDMFPNTYHIETVTRLVKIND